VCDSCLTRQPPGGLPFDEAPLSQQHRRDPPRVEGGEQLIDPPRPDRTVIVGRSTLDRATPTTWHCLRINGSEWLYLTSARYTTIGQMNARRHGAVALQCNLELLLRLHDSMSTPSEATNHQRCSESA